MPFNLGGPELIIILVIVLIVFGAGKLPNVMRDVGKGVKEFKNAQSGDDSVPTTSTSVAAPVAPETHVSAAPSASINGTANGTTASVTRTTETSSRA